MDTRVASYAVVIDDRGILLAHWNVGGRSGWTLPGGGLDPGEDPLDAVVREVHEETGFVAVVDELLGIDSHVIAVEHRTSPATAPQHAIRIVYRARAVGGALRDEIDGSTDTAAWFALEDVAQLDRVELVDRAMAMAGVRTSVGGGIPVPDGAVPDGAVPDGAMPDGAVPDGAVPDGVPDAVPRTAAHAVTGDAALADAALSDSALADAALAAAERALQDALRNGDVDALDAMLHPDAHYISPEGVVTDRADDLHAHRSGALRLTTVREISLAATRVGNVGVTTAVLGLTGADHGYAFDTTLAYTRTWLHGDGRWLVLAAHASVVHPD